jgi:hypothetical protein
MPGTSAKLSPNVETLIGKGVLDRLPVTFSAYCVEQMRKWDLLFPAEQNYYERLLALFGRSSAEDVTRLFAGVREAEVNMGVDAASWPKRQFTLEQVDFLNRNAHYPEWRAAVAGVFAHIDPILDKEVASHGHPRLVVVLAPAELPVGSDRMWLRIQHRGARVPIKAPEDTGEFLPQLLTGASRDSKASALTSDYAQAHSSYDSWAIEAAAELADLVAGRPVKLSYIELEKYRKRLMAEVNQLVSSETIQGPRQLSARLNQMKVLPAESHLAADPVMAEFTRATLLSGNGTLLLNNTFVEWAAVQAIRRARPSVAVISFGIRNKVKPFSSLLIYADQEKVNSIPTQVDTLGSYVDLEVFYQYLWQECEKYAEYRNNTVYVFAAVGMDEMLVIAPQDFPLRSSQEPVELTAVHQSLKTWLNLA